MLYKRPFRKEKEVVTFLINSLKWTLAINVEAPSLMRGLNAHCSVAQQGTHLSPLAPRVQELPILNKRGEDLSPRHFTRLNFDYRASLIVK